MAGSNSRSDQQAISSRFKLPLGKGTQTRKFFGKQPLDRQDDVFVKSKSNSDHLVEAASGMNVVARAVEKAAAAARQTLGELDQTIRESIETDTGDDKRGFQGTKYAKSDLQAIQNSFIDSVVTAIGLETINSSDARVMVESAVSSLIKRGTVSSIEDKPIISPRINKAVPDIDFVQIVFSDRGLVDRYSTQVKFTLPNKLIREEKVKAFRIFRAKKKSPESTRPHRVRLNRHGAAEIQGVTMRTRNKNFAKEGAYESLRFDQNGIENSLSLTTKIDEFTGLRTGLVSSSGSAVFATRDPEMETKSSDNKNLESLLSFLDLTEIGEIDASVVNDLKAIRNIQIQNPNLTTKYDPVSILSGGTEVSADTLSKLGHRHRKEIKKRAKIQSSLVMDKPNASNYKELTVVPIIRLKNRKVGPPGAELVEFSYIDNTVELGSTYTYYVSSLDETITESVRSRIVKITIEDVVPPREPRSIAIAKNGSFVTLCMLANLEDNVVKFEIYRKLSMSNRKEVAPENIPVIDSELGFTVERESREALDTGYVQVGESLNTKFGGSTFVDKTSVQGKKYIYRIYSVDVHGNKSQHPKEIVVFLNERSSRITDLRKPTILAEVDATTKNIRITIIGDDPRVKAFFLARKNNTLKERAFTIPTQPSQIRQGNCESAGCKTFEDTVMRSSDNAWTGYFENNNKQILFLDKTTRIDNTYQYSVYAVDRFGNKSSYAVSSPLFISTRPLVDAPLNITAISGKNGVVTLAWDDGNIDIDPEDRIGNRDVLEETIFRTLYQIERKKKGSEIWDQFPLTEHRSFDDRIAKSGEKTPSYRPVFLEVDSNYMYRVSAMQTGNFISNFSNTVSINTFTPVARPIKFKIKSCDTKCEPFFTTLNWDTPKNSGTVDRWKIERAVVNNFAAARLNVTNTKDIEKLNFEHVIDVFKESSRSRARVFDVMDSRVNKDSRKNRVLSGQHHYIDSDVEFGNTYFYRLTAVGINTGNTAKPIIRGIKISDPSFERKINASITQTERNLLARDTKPLRIRSPLIRGFSQKRSVTTTKKSIVRPRRPGVVTL